MPDTEKFPPDVSPRDFSSSPDAFSQKAVHEWLVARGAQEIINSDALATILGISVKTIKIAEKNKKIKAIDRSTYILKDCIPWIMEHPKYFCQQKPHWEITDSTVETIKKIIRNDWRALLRYWEFDDLCAEVQYRMITLPKTSACAEGIVIRRVLAKIWRDMKRKGLPNMVSLDAINEKHERF